MIEFKLETVPVPGENIPAVSIIGLGGSGGNVLDHIALEGMDGVDLIAMNCDARSLNSGMAQHKIQLGKSLTQGLGCGGDPELGQEAAIGSMEDIRAALTGRRMIFLCVGLGGGTGSGAAPVVARLARETGAFVIVFATLPFSFEGKRRMAQAQAALTEIRQHANALVCFENDKMGELVLPKKGVTEAFEVADRIICQSVRAVTTVATQPGLIRIGMDDLITALKNADSRCLFGFGQAKGEARATDALQAALKSPLLDRGQLLEKARNVLVHICGGTSLTLFEIETLMHELHKHVSDEAQILFGAACDAKLNDTLSVTIISSLGKEKPATLPVAEEKLPAPRPAVPVTPIISPHTRAVPILSVQPRQAPPAQLSGLLAPGAATMTSATSSVPVLRFTARIEPPRPAKPVRPAPLAPPQPDLFAAPIAFAPVAGKEIVEAAAPPTVKEIVEPGMEEAMEEDAPAMVAEEELAAGMEIEEVIATREEMIAEPEPETCAEEEMIEEPEIIAEETNEPEPEPVEEFVAEEEIEIEAEAEDGPQHPAFSPDAEHAPMRPMHVPPPAARPAARKFDLREILQRQRQTRLGYQRAHAPAEPPSRAAAAPKPVPPPQRPAAPARPAIERTPNPDRVAPIRPIPATRSTSPFIPTRAGSVPAASPHGRGEQATFDEHLVPVVKAGRFEKTVPTVEEGEDLDVPTFLRKKR